MAGGRRRYCLPFAVWKVMGVARVPVGSVARQSSVPMNAKPPAVTMGGRRRSKRTGACQRSWPVMVPIWPTEEACGNTAGQERDGSRHGESGQSART